MRTFRAAFRRFLLCVALPLGGGLLAGARAQTGAALPIDSLIKRIPQLMRSDEGQARRLIDELTSRAAAGAHKHGTVQATFFRCWLSYRHEPPETAIRRIDSALQHLPGIQQDTALVKFHILKGQCYVKRSQFGQALEHFHKALDVATRRGDTESRTNTLVSIGWAYMEDAKPKEAIGFFEEVLQVQPGPDYSHRALLLCNIAACHNTMGNFRLAETVARDGIAAARLRNSNSDLANGLNILGRSYYQQGRTDLAIATLREAAVAREKVADPSMLASDYLALADVYSKTGQLQQAVSWAKKAEAVSVKTANSLKLAAVYESLADIYEAQGDHRNAVLCLRRLLDHKDSLANDRHSQAYAEMQVQYETQKKTSENLQLKQENLEARLRNSNQQRWLVALVAGLLLLAASALYLFKLAKSRYQARLAEEQVNEQKRRMQAVMEAEEEERRRIAGELHDGVGQTLAAASLLLAKAQKGGAPLTSVDDLIHQAGQEVRSLSHQVTPVLLQHYGLAKAMEQAVARLNESGAAPRFSLFTHIEQELPAAMAALTLYRCFQELCTNVLKHARATEVVVQLTTDAEEVQLLVEDNGVGLAGEHYGLGMKNMETRLALYNGVLMVDSAAGRGTTIIIRMPRPAAEPLKTT